jgi:leader peptidase (prepilin peptidase)/N-methyltransferase
MSLTALLAATTTGGCAGPWLRGLVFAHTVAYRQPPRSRCPTCATLVVPVALRGVVALAPLDGRCPSCATGIGPPPGTVELIAAAVLFLIALHAPSDWVLAAWCWAALFAVALALIDTAVLRLPDILTATAGLGALILLGLAAAATDQPNDYTRSALGGASLGLLYLAPILSTRMSMGRGDGHLAVVIGVCLGWISFQAIMTATTTAALIALLYSGTMLATRRLHRADPVPVGPIMLLGALAALTFTPL